MNKQIDWRREGLVLLGVCEMIARSKGIKKGDLGYLTKEQMIKICGHFAAEFGNPNG